MKKIFAIFLLIITVELTTGAGYVGTLPNVDGEFSYLRKDVSEKASAPFSVEELDKQNASKLKPVPSDNDEYVDIIVKKDKTSRYANDVNDIVKIMEKLRVCINTDKDIQKFNAIVSNLIDNIEYLRVEYKDQPESNYLSYNKLQLLSKQAADTAKLRTRAISVQGYIPETSPGNIYTGQNIQKHIDDLQTSISETIYILKNLE